MDRPGVDVASASVDEKWTPDGGAMACDELEWLRYFAKISPVAIFRADLDGRCIYVSERWSELSGYPREMALGTGWEHAVHPNDVEPIRTQWTRMRGMGIPFRCEFRYVQPEGKIVWVLAHAMEQRGPDGTALGYVATLTDVSELHRVRQELQLSHGSLEERVRERAAQYEHMTMIVAASADAIISADLEGLVVSWNGAAERIFGYRAEEMIGQSESLLSPARRVDDAKALRDQVRAGERVDYLETILMARSGELIEAGLSVFPLRDVTGKVTGTSSIVRDIREQKKAERRLHQISGRLLRVQDEERRRLARELHDSTAQSLAALSMNLAVLTGAASQLDKKYAQLLADGLALAQTIERELRTHTYLLHPPLLDERGLPAALRWLSEGFSARSGIIVDLDIQPGLGRLRHAVELTIFRVAQESLSNVHRHSKSPTVSVSLRESAWSVALEVRDVGRGLPAEAGENGGVGIAGMRERLAQVGGTLRMESGPTGTTVTASILK